MEAVEILIYIGIAVIVGVLITGFLADWDYMQMYHDVQKLMQGEEKIGFEKVDRFAFAGRIESLFKECISSGQDSSVSLYLNENGSMSKSDLFDHFKTLGWCETIQSAENDCGTREDLSMGTLTLPKVVQINCSGTKLVIS
jgi:hypothetical protein